MSDNNTEERRVLNKAWLLQHISQFPEDNISELHIHMWFSLYGSNIKIEEETKEDV